MVVEGCVCIFDYFRFLRVLFFDLCALDFVFLVDFVAGVGVGVALGLAGSNRGIFLNLTSAIPFSL